MQEKTGRNLWSNGIEKFNREEELVQYKNIAEKELFQPSISTSNYLRKKWKKNSISLGLNNTCKNKRKTPSTKE